MTAAAGFPPPDGYAEGMQPSVIDMAPLIQELEGVAEQLENGGLKGEKRLALLRRQAQLGDLRDAILLRARRGLQ